MISRPVMRGLLVALLGQSLLVWNTGAVLHERGDQLLDRQPRRFWEDLSLAIGYFKTGELPVGYNSVQRWTDEKGETYYRERGGIITNSAAKTGLGPWRFWRLVPPRALNRLDVGLVPRFDDVGRPWLLGLAFRLMGGVAPYLFFWLGALFAFPILAWLAVEIDSSGRPAASALATLGIASSAFLSDSLALAYSAAGFYVLGVLLLAAFGASAILRAPTGFSLISKSLLAGLVLAILTACRSGTLLLLPGFVLMAFVGARRGRIWNWRILTLACAALCMPTLALSASVSRMAAAAFAKYGGDATPPQHHAVWFGVWTGLGDFDRQKGYLWNDAAASAFLVQHGGSPLGPGSYDSRNETILRTAILSDVASDPKWYVGILVRRVTETLAQWRILPWRPLQGRSSQFDAQPGNYLASYYSLTAHVDVLRFYPLEIEFPFWLPAVATFVLLVAVRGSAGWYMTSVGAGCLVLPLLITTAGAIEPMAFGLIYFPGASLAVDALWRSRLAQRLRRS